MAVSQTLSLSEVANSQGVSGNTSKVRILWKSTQTGESYNSVTKTAYYWITTPDGKETKYSVSYTLPKGTTKTILDKTITVTHKDDGSGSVKVRTWMDTGISAGEVTLSKSLTLDTIPRAATITSAGDVTLGNKCSVKWTPASKSFRYKLEFILGVWSYKTPAIHPNQTSAYTYSGYTIPLEAAQQLMYEATGTMTVKLYTYSDSDATKQIGSASSKTFTVTVPDTSGTRPSVTMVLSPVGSLGVAFDGLYIQGKTKVKADLTAVAKYDASVMSTYFKVDGVTYDLGDDFTSDNLSKYGNFTVYGYAEDSRGYTGSASKKITVISYAKPQIQAASGESDVVAARCDANGNLIDSGTYLKIKAKRSYSPVKSGEVQHNFCKIRYRYKHENATSYSSWTTILAGDSLDSDEIITGPMLGGVLAVDSTYLVQVQAIDDVGEYGRTTITIPNDKVYMHRDKVRRSLSIGKYIEDDNTVDIAADIDVKIRGELEVIGKGWITPTLEGGFELYSTGSASAVRYRKVGGIVEIRGAVKPTTAIAGSDTTYPIFTLPEGYRPSNVLRVVCQGSYWYHWLLMVKTNGEVSFSRYSDGTKFTEAPTTAWLPFQITFIADQ